MTERNGLLAATVVVALLWTGLLLGVSFLATPVKFMAPSLTLPVALDVGRQTFMVFNWLELLLSALLVPLVLMSRRRALVLPALAAAALVLMQSLWLLPVLDARVEIILQGGTPPASSLHSWYIAAEGLKLVLLVVLAVLAASRRPERAPA